MINPNSTLPRKTRLGIDLGSTSLGWCLIEVEVEKTPDGQEHEVDGEILAIGSRIFSDGRDPKKGSSLAVDRRIARGARRRRDRFLRRQQAFLRNLRKAGLFPTDTATAKKLELLDPYVLRTRALDEQLTPHEIGRALFHLNQRRGFKSNRKTDNPDDSGKISSGTKNLDMAMQDSGARTLGEYLNCHAKSKRVRSKDAPPAENLGPNAQKVAQAKANKDAINNVYDFYPDRRHYEDEFTKIWDAQKKHHPTLLTAAAHENLHRILFFQRPLKDPIIGLCSFSGVGGIPDDAKRLPKAHPLFQERRLYEEVNQLAITTPGLAPRKLTMEQRDKLILKLRDKKKVTFRSLATALKLVPDEQFNKESENRKDMLGNEVYAELSHKERFGDKQWKGFSFDERWVIIEKLLEEQDPDTLRTWLMETYHVDEEAAKKIAAAKLPEGYGRFGEEASRRILDALKDGSIADDDGIERPMTYDQAVEYAGLGPHSNIGGHSKIYEKLPYYGEILWREITPGSSDPKDRNDPNKQDVYWGKITNPTVHIGLNQIRRVVNEIIEQHGREDENGDRLPPDEINIELARDLKLNDKQKQEIKKQHNKNIAAAEKRSEKLKEHSVPDTGANRAVLRLWEENNIKDCLGRHCPYCDNENPISIGMLFNGLVDVDHIIPYSKSMDDSFNNKIVAHRKCNREKVNKTPYEKWGHDTDRWAVIQSRIQHLPKAKQWRFAPDAMERFKKDEDGFHARQLKDTQYLSRSAAKYLQALYGEEKEGGKPKQRHVFAIPGQMSALLRGKWGLNSILWALHREKHGLEKQPRLEEEEYKKEKAKKNRNDHRHHAIDAAVVAVTSNSLLNKIAKAAGETTSADGKEKYKEVEEQLAKWNAPPPWEDFRKELKNKLRTTIISHKADHGLNKQALRDPYQTSGQLHEETAYGLRGYDDKKGSEIVCYRIPLLSVKPKHFQDEDCIVDSVLRDALYRVTEGLTDKEYENALRDFAADPDLPDGKPNPYLGMQRVRIRKPLNVIKIKDKNGKFYKAYKGGSNARYDIWQLLPNEKGECKWVADVLSTYEIHQPNFDEQKRRPHPAAKKIMSLRQNDLIAIEKDGGPRQIMRVQKFTQAGPINLVDHQEAGNLDKRDKEKDDPFKLWAPGVTALKNMKARQIRIDVLGKIWDPGPPQPPQPPRPPRPRS